ncbi:phage portal protein [Algisphaera agarilytica]|uniref:HK97 family phage portal protein n=1 Tax=Algisphaera agarilytica TaxID=1385975 RepID=A0A7X0H4Q8_9BACT|nr:phage portal protein [Algisphaera agarilytica]MBB6429214.1 HK97 family phage portal protein [Algisphaera agarilytica]
MRYLNRLVAAAQLLVRGPVPFSRWLSQVAAGGKDRPTEVYNQVAPVRVCVQYISRIVGSIPFRISTPDSEIIETGPLAQLAVRPNPKQSMGQFMRDSAAFWLIYGRVHFWTTGQTVNELESITINPLQMEAIEEEGELVGWWYSPLGNGERVRLPLDEVHTFVDPDYHAPDKAWKGMGAREAVAMAIAQYYKADLANEASLDNDVQPSGAVSTEQNLSPDQERSLLKQIDAEYAGSRNRRRIMLLQGGLSWQQMAANFTDMEFMEGRAFSREEICAAFGLKAILFYGQSGSGLNDDQAQSAGVTAHQGVIRPLMRMLAEEFNCAVLSRLQNDRSMTLRDGLKRGDWSRRKMLDRQRGSDCYLRVRDAAVAQDLLAVSWFDDTGEAVTVELWQHQATGAKTWFDMGVPLNAIIDATDAPFEKLPHGDIPRIAMGLVAADETGAAEPGFDDPDGSISPGDELGDPLTEPEEASAQPVQRELSESQLTAMWRNLRAQVTGIEKQLLNPYKRHLMQLRAESLGNIRRLDPGRPEVDRSADLKNVVVWYDDFDGRERQVKVQLSRQQRDLLGDLLFDLRKATDGRWAIVAKFMRQGLAIGGNQSMAEAASAEDRDEPDPFSLDDPGVTEALRRREFDIAGLTTAQRDRLRAVYAQALADGKTTAELVEIGRKQFNIESGRAKLVAFQESSSAVEEGRQLGREQAGVPAKSWLWSRKETGRSAHAATERATLADPVPIDQDFTIAGTSITCPHPRATGIAEQDINCGCTTISRYPGDRVRDLAVLRFIATARTPMETNTP